MPHLSRINYLYRLHDDYNKEAFEGKLLPIRLLLKRAMRKDGWYEYDAHQDWTPIKNKLHKAVICISDGCFEEDTVEGTLLHEMIHQWQCEVLGEPPHHNETFKEKARLLEEQYEVEVL